MIGADLQLYDKALSFKINLIGLLLIETLVIEASKGALTESRLKCRGYVSTEGYLFERHHCQQKDIVKFFHYIARQR